MHRLKLLPGAVLAVTFLAGGPEVAPVPEPTATHEQAVGRLSIKNADPSVIRVDSTYISAETEGGRIYVRTASSVDALSGAARSQIWGNPNNWAEV
ncbi:hypothetical protein [Stigmatella aurantiaca]|uniref:Putative secreted hydrolase n=1 Tax=Stigmatella aurantiaca (strain DW4/3-1) TaxID=378806 RepID=Q08PV8_STIAD|nr:hypothetical protein [Stigmatella aurantiaca]ADO74568.1 uncharacterized protein STAUR_6811 [Stigmatella aurantiaca DW4/3-1]EAU62524.1 putative secreted hydrolase [Stigmatella aurantiaca DW4/3-1]